MAFLKLFLCPMNSMLKNLFMHQVVQFMALQKKSHSRNLKNLAPVSLYGSTKLSNENIANLFYEKFNLNCIGLRFFTVYGPRGRPDMAYFHFENKIKNNEPITVYNEGKMSRDMTYVDDICDGIIKSMKIEFKKPEIFNLGNNRPINLLDLINFLEKSFGKKANIFYETSIDEIKKYSSGYIKNSKNLNYHPKTSSKME